MRRIEKLAIGIAELLASNTTWCRRDTLDGYVIELHMISGKPFMILSEGDSTVLLCYECKVWHNGDALPKIEYILEKYCREVLGKDPDDVASIGEAVKVISW